MTTTIPRLTPAQLARFDALLSRGLCAGAAITDEVAVCSEQALALDEGLTDAPSCVADPDRDFVVGLNDCLWSMPAARAAGMRPLVLAQIGTAGSDRTAWVRAVVAGTIRVIIPLALRSAALVHPDEGHRSALEAAASQCEAAGDSASRSSPWAAEAAARAGEVAADAARAAGALAADTIFLAAVQVALDAYEATASVARSRRAR